MISPAGTLLVPVGFVLLISFIFWFLITIPLNLSLFLVRDYSRLSGEVRINFGIMNLVFQVKRPFEGSFRICTKPVWLLSLPSSEYSAGEEKEKIEKKEEPSEDSLQISEIIPLISLIIDFLDTLFRHIHIDRIHCRGTIGCGDPFTTGVAFGYLQSMIPFVSKNQDEIVITPDFEKNICEGDLELNLLIKSPVLVLILLSRTFIPLLLQKHISRKRME